MRLVIHTVLGGILLLQAEALATLPDAFIGKEEPPLEVKKDDEMDEIPDPFMPVNKVVFHFNRAFDAMIFKPTAQAYRSIVPSPVRQGVSNVLYNLVTPVHAMNWVMQREGEKAAQQISRFFFNLVFGVFGICDAASRAGIPSRSTDFDTTLASYKIPTGPYLVLPVLGASDVRNVLGRVVSFVVDPYNRLAMHSFAGQRDHLIYIRAIVDGIHTRSQYIEAYETLEKNSPALYEALRSIHAQKARAKQGDPSPTQSGPKPVDDWETD